MDQSDNPWAGNQVNTSSDDWSNCNYFVSHLTDKQVREAIRVFNSEKQKGWNKTGPPELLRAEALKRGINF